MPAPLRRLILCVLVAALALLAHLPLFGAGFVGGDLELLAAAAGRDDDSGGGAWLAGGEVRPIPAWLLRLHATLHAGLSPLEPAVAAPYFAVALAVLLLGAAGAGLTLRRVLVPWLGESAARAAGWACAGLVVAHPASVAAVARPSALGDVVALALGAWSTAFFLRGRQQRKAAFLALAALCAAAAGCASSAAWLLPFACGALEFASAHRPRSLPQKLGAACSVALAATLAVALEALLAWPQGFGLRAGTPWSALLSGGPDPAAALAALGALFVPVPSPGAAGAYLACGAALCCAAEPLLRAARAAPRLWGWLALGWIAAIGASLPLARDLHAPPGSIERADTLLVPAVVVCAALATASTALGGSRRSVLPLAIAAILCVLGDRAARVWPQATRDLAALGADLERGLAAAEGGRVLVVGAPRATRLPSPRAARVRGGFDVPEDLDLLAGAWPPRSATLGSVLARAEAAAVPYVARLPSEAGLTRRGLAVLLLDRDGRPAIRVPPRAGAAKPFVWRDDGRSELVELDPLALTVVRVTPRAGVSTAEPPRLRWRATHAAFENGAIDGAWVATDDGPQAIFDLGRSIEWLLGGTIRRLWFEGELRRIVTAEVLPAIEVAGLELADDGFAVVVPEDSRPRAWKGDATWVGIEVRAPGAVREALGSPSGNGRVTFELEREVDGTPTRIVECRVGGVAVARSTVFPRAGR
ncbi:MAG: hypothetical protein JNK02_09835 [Planctomycetes bacterium]|nr:hypothetical protein [Planctomycetota bacterium]